MNKAQELHPSIPRLPYYFFFAPIIIIGLVFKIIVAIPVAIIHFLTQPEDKDGIDLTPERFNTILYTILITGFVIWLCS